MDIYKEYLTGNIGFEEFFEALSDDALTLVNRGELTLWITPKAEIIPVGNGEHYDAVWDAPELFNLDRRDLSHEFGGTLGTMGILAEAINQGAIRVGLTDNNTLGLNLNSNKVKPGVFLRSQDLVEENPKVKEVKVDDVNESGDLRKTNTVSRSIYMNSDSIDSVLNSDIQPSSALRHHRG